MTDRDNTVELLGFYGGDETHALSAWTSTSRELDDAKRARIPALLARLAKDGHHTPFEKSTLHFLVTTDLATHIHLLKHRIAVPLNAESARYKELRDDKHYVPHDWPEPLKLMLCEHMEESFALYHKCIEHLTLSGYSRKRAKESARYFLPYANQLTADVSFNFRSFMHFQRLRNSPDAQLEVREVAQRMLELAAGIGAFEHSLNAFNVEV